MRRSRLAVVLLTTAVAALLVASAVQALAASSARTKSVASSDQPTMKVIVLVKAKGDAGAVIAKLKAKGAKHIYKYHLIKAVAATVSPATRDALRKDKNVAQIRPDRQLTYTTLQTTDPGTTATAADTRWTPVGDALSATAEASVDAQVIEPILEPEALQLTHAEDAWTIEVDGAPVMGQGIRVGMLDSGTDPNHPDLAGAIEAYRDFGGNGLRDWTAHGTGTSSTVVGQGLPVFNHETRTFMRFSGMAPKAKVLMAKVWSNDNIGFESAYLRGLQWLVDQKVDIINCGGAGPGAPLDGSDFVSRAVQAAIDKGITCVALALNEGPGQGVMSTPAPLKDVVTVGAVSANRAWAQVGFLTSGTSYKSGQAADFFARGPNARGDFKPDILGVGDDQWALAPMHEVFTGPYSRGSTQGLQWFGGTSQASPTVAGNLALAMSAWKMAHPGKPLPEPAYWKKLLASTATDLGYPAADNSTGLVNGEAAVKAVLGQGPSLLVSVADDPKNPQSWSVQTDGGTSASTTIRVKNTGDVAQHVTFEPTTFVAGSKIEDEILLTAADGYVHSEQFAVPAGTDLVSARCVWSSSPYVALRVVLYDSAGNLVARNTMDAGYGHLALAQASLGGPAETGPVVDERPWTITILPLVYPYPPQYAFYPAADQPARFRIEFKQKAPWGDVTVTPSSVDVNPGHWTDVTATLTAPDGAGTYSGGIRVRGDGVATTVPVSIRVPVDMADGVGEFSGELTGSSKQLVGGDMRYYDFTVPAGTSSIQASFRILSGNEGNLVLAYLVDPSGKPVCNKGGDVMWVDWPAFMSPDSAFTHTAEQLIWDDPAPGKWQLTVWEGGYSGIDFSEEFEGNIVLDREAVSPAEWTGSAAPGDPVSTDFTVTNTGPSELIAYADSRLIIGGDPVYVDVVLYGMRGKLTPTTTGCMDWLFFPVPQRARSARVDVASTNAGSMIDLSLWDPVFASRAQSAAVSLAGNSVSVDDPMSGYWSAMLTLASDVTPAAPTGYRIQFSCELPIPMDGLTSSATGDAPVVVMPGESETITATFTVPPEASPGDQLTGRLDFYTIVDMLTCAGGDRLASVPVTITVE